MKRKIVLLISSIFIMLLLTGCMTKSKADKIALKKFEDKYGLEYKVKYKVKYTENISDSIENRNEIHVYVPSLMDDYESAIIYSWIEKGKAISSDNLFEYVIREEFEKNITKIGNAKFGNIKAYTTFVSTSFNNSLDLNSTLEDAYDVGEKMIASTCVVVLTDLSEVEFQKIADEVAEELKSIKHFSSITFYPVCNTDEFNSITRENCQDKVDLFSKYSLVQMPYDAYENYSYDCDSNLY